MDWMGWFLLAMIGLGFFILGALIERARWSRVLQDSITRGYDAPTSDDTWMKLQA